MKKPFLVAVVVLAVVLLFAGYFLMARVPSGMVAVVPADGSSAPEILGPGLHMKAPGTRLSMYPTKPVSVAGKSLVTAPGGGSVGFDFTVTARLEADRIGSLAPAIGDQPLEVFLQNQVATLLQQSASGMEPMELLSPDFRSQAQETIARAMLDGGMAEASVAISSPDSDSFLSAAQYLAPLGEAWKLRLPLSEALLEPGRSGDWKLLTAMGLVNESEKLLVDAERNYLDALAIDPTALAPMSQLFTLYSTVGEWAKLQRVLDAALTVQPESVQHLTWTAMALIRRDDLVGAERMLTHALELEPGNPSLLSNLGVLYMKMETFEDAERTFRQAVDADRTNPQALYNLGTALAAADRFEEALPYLEQAEQQGSRTGPLLNLLAFVHDKLGHRAKARDYRKQAEEMEKRQKTQAPS